MTSVAVVAHAGKSIGGGLDELRAVLDAAGVSDPLWFEIAKSKKATKRARQAVRDGADLVFVWGGDGTVQHCADALAGSGATMAIIPAGTANLLATELDIPFDIEQAVHVGLHGDTRSIDVGVLNGERFTVMAGAGFDARMMRDADGRLKERFGRLAYVWSGAKNLRSSRVKGTVTVDGKPWFKGRLGMVLIANVGKIFGGVTVFEDARVDSGRLEVGVVTARGAWQWTRALTRTAVGHAAKSPFVETASGHTISIRLKKKLPYELDGADRKAKDRLEIRVEPGALDVRVPERPPA